MTTPKRDAFYLRVSTSNGHQTVENQQRELEAKAKAAGWQIVATYSEDQRLQRPRQAPGLGQSPQGRHRA